MERAAYWSSSGQGSRAARRPGRPRAAGSTCVLYEMQPAHRSPAHRSDDFAELVCSNSLRSAPLANAVGLLKEEMRRARLAGARGRRRDRGAGRQRARRRSRRLRAARDAARSSRTRASRCAARASRSSPTSRCVVLATGPLTDPELAGRPARARSARSRSTSTTPISPIVYADSLDARASRSAPRAGERPRDEGDYLNLRARSRRATRPSSTRCSPPTRCRCTRSRRRSTSRAACRSRRWRGAAARRSRTGR